MALMWFQRTTMEKVIERLSILFSLPDGEDFYSQVFDSTVTECLRSEVQQLTSIYSNTSVIATVKLSEPSSKIGIDAK
jgi:hypothetical protein